jgi:hypothetical protein
VHSDHAGSAERARVEAAAAIRLHPDDAELADGRTHRQNEHPVAAYLWRPAAVAAMWELIAGGGLGMPGLGGYSQLSHGDRLEVPGCPTVVGLPGHTRGSVGFVVPDRDACFSGDALVTLERARGCSGSRAPRPGPRLAPSAVHDDAGHRLRRIRPPPRAHLHAEGPVVPDLTAVPHGGAVAVALPDASCSVRPDGAGQDLRRDLRH